MDTKSERIVDDSYSDVLSECNCKVGKIAEKYNAQKMANSLGDMWREEDESVREIATTFNIHILNLAMENTGMNNLEGEVENIYRLLKDDDVSKAEQIRAKRRLEQNGLEPDEISTDFVSYQTVYRHLTNCLELQNSDLENSEAKRAKIEKRIRSLTNRTNLVISKTLKQLSKSFNSGVQKPNVTLSVTVWCDECGTSMNLEDVLTGDQCQCLSDET